MKVISSSLKLIFISPSYFFTILCILFNPIPCIEADFLDDSMRPFLTAILFLTEFVICIDRYLFFRTKAKKSINPFSVFCADPDLIIRPSGEYRISNFMLWQAAYTEFVIMNKLWPDFEKSDLDEAINIYSQRNRRFGGV